LYEKFFDLSPEGWSVERGMFDVGAISMDGDNDIMTVEDDGVEDDGLLCEIKGLMLARRGWSRARLVTVGPG
jgi:hypothetical protein